MLLPHLAQNVELTRRYADCYEGFPGFAHPYDPLLDEYEPEMTTEQMRAVLTGLREGLVPLVREAADSGAGRVEDPFRGDFPADRSVELVAELLSELPFPEDAWRIDPTEHPFAISIGRGDVRLTTRYDESNLAMALFSAMHEAGHGLYEAGVDAELRRTPLAKPRSLGLHESQSRLWENWVARSRPYLERLLPRLREHFPGGFDEVDGGRARPGGQPGRALADPDRGRRGDLQPPHPDPLRARAGDLRGRPRARPSSPRRGTPATASTSASRSPTTPTACCRTCTGRRARSATSPPTASATSSPGSSGRPPAATSAIWTRRIADGDLRALGEWLRDRVHRHGRRLSPAEILERAGCGELSVEPLLDHLRDRVALAVGT